LTDALPPVVRAHADVFLRSAQNRFHTLSNSRRIWPILPQDNSNCRLKPLVRSLITIALMILRSRGVSVFGQVGRSMRSGARNLASWPAE
jgi:hypothetical protein